MWQDKPIEDYGLSPVALQLLHSCDVTTTSHLMPFNLAQLRPNHAPAVEEIGRVRAQIYRELHADPASKAEDWIGVDLDRTLAEFRFGKWDGIDHIGNPLPGMVERIKKGLEEGKKFKIFTARVCNCGRFTHWYQTMVIQQWCMRYLGVVLPITNMKDCSCREIWDDVARQVIPNTGEFLDEKYKALEAEKESLRLEVERLREANEALREGIRCLQRQITKTTAFVSKL